MQDGKGNEVLADLHCTCTICTESKTEAPSQREFKCSRTPMSSVTGECLISTDPYFSNAMDALKKLDETEQISDQEEVPSPTSDDASKARPIELRRCSTKSRECWHADTIPLGKTWNHIEDALVTVDDFTCMSFVYSIKDKSLYSVAAALEEHFFQQRPTSTGIKGINLFINCTVLRSDRGTEYVNSSVHDLCERLGCNVEYTCPGQLGKHQNGLVERCMKKIGRFARCGKKISGVPDLASSYCVLYAVDILSAVPTKANPIDGTTDVTGFSRYLKYYGSQPSMDSFYVFGSYCSVHMDNDHANKTNKNVTASPCIYLCNAGHFKS